MNSNLKQFLEADALRTQGEWMYNERHDSSCGHPCTENGCHDSHPSGIYDIDGPELGEWPDDSFATTSKADANFIAAASRIAPDIRAMQDALEKVCKALEIAERAINGREHTGFIDKALTAAAPYRKGGV